DTGEPVSFEAKPFEFPGQPERGTTYWDWALVPVKDEAGGVRGLVLSATDVTAEVRARQERERLLVQIHEEQQRTEEANRLLQAIIETMPAGAVISDAGGHVFLTNSTGRDILGAAVHGTVDAPERPYTPHYPDGTPMPPDDMPLAHALAERRVVRDVEIRIRRNDGSERTILAAAAPVLDEEDELTSGVTLFLDITARKQIQAERERLLAILEQTPDLVAMVRADGDLIYLNRAARQAVDLADYPRDSLPAHGFPLEHPSWARRLVEEEGIPTAIAQGVWRGRTAIVDGDGAEIPLSQIIIAHPGPKGKVAYLSTVARDVSERERILAALQEERSRFQAIFENAPEAILVAGAGGRIVLANEAAQALYHRPVPFGEPFTPADVVQVLHPDGTPFEPDDYPILRAALRGEHVRHAELAVIWDGGERRDLLVSAAPLRDVDGGLLGAVTLMQDITDQKETQRALATYADRLHTLHIADQVILSAESADEIVDAVLPLVRELVACRQASVLAFDREAAEIEVLGVDAAGETRLQRGARLPLDEGWRLEALARGELAALDDVPDASIEPVRIEALRADGLYTYVNVPLVARGELLGVLNLAADEGHTLTAGQREIVRQMADQLAIGLWQARLHAQVQRHTGRLEEMVTLRTAALRSSEARFRAIFESAALGIALLDETGHILNSNPALQQLLGYSGEALRNRALEEFTHPADRSGDAGLYAKLMAGEYEFYRIEKQYRRSDGRPLVSALTMSLVQRGSHSTPLAIAMIEDITEQKKTQQALIQSEKLALVGQLGASLTHEINNPLQGAIGCLGLAEEMVEEDGSLDQYLNIAIEELRRAARIVRQLGDLGRPSEEEFEHQPIDVEEQLDQILVLARNYCQKRRVTIGRTPADDRPIVLVEPDRIRQVFLNMVLNAADAMPEGGHLGIATTRTHDPAGIAVTFTDTGVGIDRKTLPHIFEPFYTTRPDGLGLGLYISKTIVEDHGGRIDVESEPGKGTTFTVWLPA
ncbi:MAG: PAS domain S-box protein, partial [Anaerolineae bacterium]